MVAFSFVVLFIDPVYPLMQCFLHLDNVFCDRIAWLIQGLVIGFENAQFFSYEIGLFDGFCRFDIALCRRPYRPDNRS